MCISRGLTAIIGANGSLTIENTNPAFSATLTIHYNLKSTPEKKAQDEKSTQTAEQFELTSFDFRYIDLKGGKSVMYSIDKEAKDKYKVIIFGRSQNALTVTGTQLTTNHAQAVASLAHETLISHPKTLDELYRYNGKLLSALYKELDEASDPSLVAPGLLENIFARVARQLRTAIDTPVAAFETETQNADCNFCDIFLESLVGGVIGGGAFAYICKTADSSVPCHDNPNLVIGLGAALGACALPLLAYCIRLCRSCCSSEAGFFSRPSTRTTQARLEEPLLNIRYSS